MTLTQVTKAGLHDIALDHVFTIGASGTDHYTFQGEGLNGTVNDPTLYLTRGKTYRFENGTGAHAIRIQSADNGTNGTLYNTGVTNNNTTGTVIVEVQHDAPDVLYYQCAAHPNMKGTIYITGALADDGVTTAKIADTAVTLAKLEHGTGSNDGKFLRANNGADPSFESLPASGVTVSNNANNRVVTGDGTNLNAEANATYDGTKLFLKGGTGTGGNVDLLELKHNNTASSSGNGDGPAMLFNGHYAGSDWDFAKICCVNAGGSYGSGYGAGLQFHVHPANGNINSSVVKAAEIIGDGSGANLYMTNGNIKFASGHGIDFSATANASNTGASMSSELLDDYEEGSFTPTPNTGTWTATNAKYVRIGAMCFINAHFGSVSDTTSSTAIKIPMTSLPFSKSSFTDNIYMGTCPNRYFSHSSKDTLMYWSMDGSGIHLYSNNDASGDKAYTAVEHKDIDASYSAFQIAGWYCV